MVRRWDLETGHQTDAVRLRSATGRRVYPEILSADGSRVATTESSNVVVYDTNTGRPIARVPTEPLATVNIALSPDGSRLAVGAWGDAGPRLTLHSLATGVVRDLHVEAKPRANRDSGLVLHVRFTQDGRRLVVDGPFRPGLVVFDAADGRPVFSGPRPGDEFAVSPDGARIADRGPPSYPKKASPVQLVDLASGKRFTPNATDSEFGNLAFSPDGRVLASVNTFEATSLLDAATGQILHRLPNQSRLGVRFSPDGRRLASDTHECQIEVWDVATGRRCFDPTGWFDDEAGVSPGGELVSTQRREFNETVLDLWDAATGRHIRSLPPTECYPGQLQFSPDGWRLSAFWGKSRLYSWSATSGAERGPIRFGFPEGWNDSTASALSPDGNRVAAVDRDHWEPDRSKVEVWDARRATLIRRFLLPPWAPAWDLVWAPDSRTLLVPAEGGSVLVDADSGRTGVRVPVAWMAPRPRNLDLRTYIDRPVCPRFSPDGGLIIGWRPRGEEADPDRLEVWEAATGREVIGVAVKVPTPAKYALAPAARALVVTDGQTLRLIDLATGKDRGRRELPPPGPTVVPAWLTSATALFVIPRGHRALTAQPDGTALVWDLSAFPPPPLADKHGEPELRAWWDELAGDDAAKAYAAGWKLSEAPAAEVVAFLRERVRRAKGIDREEARKGIADLDSPVFATREAATRRLQQMGPAVLPYLRHPPAGMSAEGVERLESLQRRLFDPVPPTETLRVLRAVAVLERVGTDDARKLLDALSRGVADAPETRAARSALERMMRGW
jgi:WD40 repeat protein